MLLCFILLRCLDSVAQFSANHTFAPWYFIIINRHRATADLLRGIPGHPYIRKSLAVAVDYNKIPWRKRIISTKLGD